MAVVGWQYTCEHYNDMAHVAVPYNAWCHSQAPCPTQQALTEALHGVAPPKHSA